MNTHVHNFLSNCTHTTDERIIGWVTRRVGSRTLNIDKNPLYCIILSKLRDRKRFTCTHVKYVNRIPRKNRLVFTTFISSGILVTVIIVDHLGYEETKSELLTVLTHFTLSSHFHFHYNDGWLHWCPIFNWVPGELPSDKKLDMTWPEPSVCLLVRPKHGYNSAVCWSECSLGR